MDKNTRQMVLDLILRRGTTSSSEIQKATGLSRQAVHYHLKHLIKEDLIRRIGRTKGSRYVTAEAGAPAGHRIQRILVNENLEEHTIFSDVETILNLGRTLNESAHHIVQYAFTELLNNAIEHSSARRIVITAEVKPYDFEFRIADQGVGIFQHIQQHLALDSQAVALQLLLKGKATTDPERHTGEGIFFSVRSADRMRIASHRLAIGFQEGARDIWTEQINYLRGTRVEFMISRNTRRELKNVFTAHGGAEFDFQFARTSVRVTLPGTGKGRLVSRSEARRLLIGLDRFRKVELNFEGVSAIGQSFADEIFRVFQNEHPHVQLLTTGAGEAVKAMIDHVQASGI
jgi:anti-sigma regulatory factor (Ser/Thr protein kinase)